mgnify:CR=1 FL=1
MPGQNTSWLADDLELRRFEHRSTGTLPVSLMSDVLLTTIPNPLASHVLPLLSQHLGKGKDGPAPWK